MVFKKSAVKRTKSTDILSATEYNRKRADIVEELKNKRISIQYKGGGRNYVSEDSYSDDTMNVVLSSPALKGIPQRTALWHELSHIIHNSFGAGFFSTAESLAEQEVKRIIDSNPTLYQAIHQLKNHGQTAVGHRAYASYGMSQTYLENQLKELYRMGFNAIEDQRIESLTRNVWYGTRKMFDKMRDALGERLSTNMKASMPSSNAIQNPINELLMIRFNHASEVPKADHKLHKAMEEIEGMDEFGSVVVWKRYVKPVVDKWFKKNIDDKVKDMEQQVAEEIQETEDTNATDVEEHTKVENKIDELKKITRDTTDALAQNHQDSLKRIGNEDAKRCMDKENWTTHSDRMYDKVCETIDKEQRKRNRLEDKINNTHNKLEESLREIAEDVRNDGTSNSNSVIKDTNVKADNSSDASMAKDELAAACINAGLDLDTDNTSDEDMDEMLTESAVAGTECVKELKDGLSGMSMPKNPSNIHSITRRGEDNKVDTTLVNGLRNIITKLKERNVPTLSDTGDEFDEDEYINLKQRGYGDVFKQNKLQNGVDILVSIDGSGSMEGNDNIDEARKLVSSLFKVSQSIPEITVEANVWSSDGSGDVGMTTIKTLADCKMITTHCTSGRYYETPTHEALTYSARRLKGMQGRHKMLILITDGYPQYSKNGTHLSNKTIISACKKNLRRVMQVTENVICINVEPRGYSTGEMLKEIFGKRYVEYAGVKQANEFVSKTLKRKFIEVFRR